MWTPSKLPGRPPLQSPALETAKHTKGTSGAPACPCPPLFRILEKLWEPHRTFPWLLAQTSQLCLRMRPPQTLFFQSQDVHPQLASLSAAAFLSRLCPQPLLGTPGTVGVWALCGPRAPAGLASIWAVPGLTQASPHTQDPMMSLLS